MLQRTLADSLLLGNGGFTSFEAWVVLNQHAIPRVDCHAVLHGFLKAYSMTRYSSCRGFNTSLRSPGIVLTMNRNGSDSFNQTDNDRRHEPWNFPRVS